MTKSTKQDKMRLHLSSGTACGCLGRVCRGQFGSGANSGPIFRCCANKEASPSGEVRIFGRGRCRHRPTRLTALIG